MTQKSLTELSELLRSEELAYKKCCNYVSEATDQDLKAELGRYANNHKHRFDTLLGFIESVNR